MNTGKLWAIFQDDKISTLHFETQEYRQFVAREEVSTALDKSAANIVKSPKMTKKMQQNPRNQQNDQKSAFSFVPAAPIGPLGITRPVQTFFEVRTLT